MVENLDLMKNIYAALGGDPDEVADIKKNPDMLEVLLETVEGMSGANLPAVSNADEGDVLAVVSGQWDKKSLDEWSSGTY